MLSKLPPSVDAVVAALADMALLLPLPLVVVVALLALPLLLKAYSAVRRLEWWVIRRLQLPPPSRPLQEPTGQLCQVFISHAEEQKEGFVDFLLQEFHVQYPALRVVLQGSQRVPPSAKGHPAAGPFEDAFVCVLILSKEFISSRQPMEALHLLLQRQGRGSGAKLLPVLHGLSRRELTATLREYRRKAYDALKQQWAADLDLLLPVPGVYADKADKTGPSLVTKVVNQATKALASMNQLRVAKFERLPDITVSLEAASERVFNLLRPPALPATSPSPAADAPAPHVPKLVVLTGMGGIGKTTLAKVVFNRLHALDRTALCHFLRLDPAAGGRGVVQKQQELLWELACVASETRVATAEDGRQLLRKKLERRRVLLVVDNVWGDELKELLPGGILKTLGEGSVVLVTCRDAAAAEKLAGKMGGVTFATECLSERDSRELLCRHAYPRRGDAPDDDADLVGLLLARCQGLPMALEVVGKYLARVRDRQGLRLRLDDTLAHVYSAERANRLERRRTVFEELRLSWDALEAGEKEALLDVAWFLRKQEWDMAKVYCGGGALERLRNLALVALCKEPEPGGASRRVVGVHPVVVDFCKWVVRGQPRTRLELRAADIGEEPIWGELSSVQGTHGFLLRGWDLDPTGCDALSEQRALRLLCLSECSLSSPQQRLVPLSGPPSLGWLTLEGRSEPRVGGVQDLSLKLQGLERLTVLDLRNLPDLVQLSGLQSCAALRCMSVAGCSSLRLLNLAGLGGLRQLRIRECDELREVLGVTAALTRLVVADCERIRAQDVSREVSALKRGDSLSDQGSLPQQPPDPEGAEVAEIEKDLDRSPLHLAALQGPAKKVAELLKAGADVHAADKEGRTPLHLAAVNGKRKVVVRLLLVGAGVNAADKGGRTPLHMAAWHGRVEAASELLAAGAIVNAADKKGRTPLNSACRKCHTEVVAQLLQAGADVDLADKEGIKPLYLAASQQHVAVAELLLKAGAKAAAADKGGATRELLSKFKGSIKRELLLKAGVHLSAAGIDRAAQRPLGVGGTLAVARDLALLVSDLVSDLWCLDLTLIAFTSLYITEAVLLVDIGHTLGRLGDVVLSLTLHPRSQWWLQLRSLPMALLVLQYLGSSAALLICNWKRPPAADGTPLRRALVPFKAAWAAIFLALSLCVVDIAAVLTRLSSYMAATTSGNQDQASLWLWLWQWPGLQVLKALRYAAMELALPLLRRVCLSRELPAVAAVLQPAEGREEVWAENHMFARMSAGAMLEAAPRLAVQLLALVLAPEHSSTPQVVFVLSLLLSFVNIAKAVRYIHASGEAVGLGLWQCAKLLLQLQGTFRVPAAVSSDYHSLVTVDRVIIELPPPSELTALQQVGFLQAKLADRARDRGREGRLVLEIRGLREGREGHPELRMQRVLDSASVAGHLEGVRLVDVTQCSRVRVQDGGLAGALSSLDTALLCGGALTPEALVCVHGANEASTWLSANAVNTWLCDEAPPACGLDLDAELATLQQAYPVAYGAAERTAAAADEATGGSAWRVFMLRNCARVPTRFCAMPAARQLRVFALRCPELEALPKTLGQLRALEALDLQGCRQLQALPESIGELQALKTLTLRGCRYLQTLPGAVCELPALQTLDLEGCRGLQSLPEAIGELQGLETLVMGGCELVTELPESVGRLRALKTCNLKGCSSLAALPTSIGELRGLEVLDLGGCELVWELPEAMGQLHALKELSLQGCRGLTALPGSIGGLTRLETLAMQGCELVRELPASIGRLRALRALDLQGCSLLTALPRSIGQLAALETLNLQGCQFMLPQSVWHWQALVAVNWLARLLPAAAPAVDAAQQEALMDRKMRPGAVWGSQEGGLRELPAAMTGLRRLKSLGVDGGLRHEEVVHVLESRGVQVFHRPSAVEAAA